MADGDSRLTTDKIISGINNNFQTSEEFRNFLISRNPYNLDNEYENIDKLSLKDKGKIAKGIGSVLSVIPQYNAVNLQNSLISRIGNSTPLTDIGTVMLGKQMFYNSASHIAKQYLPSIDIVGAITGKGKLFSSPINWSITKDRNASFLDKIENALYFNQVSVPDTFSGGTSNANYIANTGNAQLGQFYLNINRNIYKSYVDAGGDETSTAIVKYSGSKFADVKLQNQITTIYSRNVVFFNYYNSIQHPYLLIQSTSWDSDGIANTEMNISLANSNTNGINEYAPDITYVKNNFGNVDKTIKHDRVPEDYISNEDRNNIDNQLIWGRDGITDNVKGQLSNLRGDDDNTILDNSQSVDIVYEYKIQRGLLEYTRNLLNASSGAFVDITRKAFINDDSIVGFNGSPLWKGNNSDYAIASQTNNKIGNRQHSIIDKYDRFDKSIRYVGNKGYGGNPNSVNYRTVIPRIHPTLNNVGSGIDNRNLMFSIENLAITARKSGNNAFIDDDSPIPVTEVGPFNGRMMWFPPYDIQINETSVAKYESTVMLGRNEPMYNYMNSERSATLNFTLLMDHPQHLINIYNDKDKNNSKKNVADFFAFGGNPLTTKATIDNIQKQLEDLKAKLAAIEGPIESNQEPDTNLSFDEVTVYFPNDTPHNDATVNTIIDTMYNNYIYEIIKGLPNGNNAGDSDGLNMNAYFINGLIKNTDNTYSLLGSTISQYQATGTSGQFNSNCKLNDNLIKAFSNELNRDYYQITLEGHSTILNGDSYNKELTQRRINAVETLITSRLKAMFPDMKTDTLFNQPINLGSVGGSIDGGDPTKVNNIKVKQERYVSIKIARNSKVIPSKEQKLTIDQINTKSDLETRIVELESQIINFDNGINDVLFNPRDKAILEGHEAVINHNYYPILQTQTPEDFHRRLTFLQQCTRQGASKDHPIIDPITNEIRAKNSVFGKQPICILRVGDFFYTKIIIENVTIDYNEAPWDMNPEGFGVQPMIAKVTLQMKLIGGQSLIGPIDALQNAIAYNYYANSTYSGQGLYAKPSKAATDNATYRENINITDKKNTI